MTDEDYSFLDEGESTTRGLLKGTMNIWTKAPFRKSPRRREKRQNIRIRIFAFEDSEGGMKGREHIVLISVFAYVGLLIPVGLYVLSLFVTRLTRRSEIHMIVVFLARDCVH